MSYIKLAEAPVLVWQSPTCSACMVDLISEEGWLCPVCGTSWEHDNADGDQGTLYTEWSGEEIEAEITPEDAAADAGMSYVLKETAEMWSRLGYCKHGRAPGGSCWSCARGFV